MTAHSLGINGQGTLSTTLPFSALTLLVGRQEGHLACKKLGVGLLVVMIRLQLCAIPPVVTTHHLHYP